MTIKRLLIADAQMAADARAFLATDSGKTEYRRQQVYVARQRVALFHVRVGVDARRAHYHGDVQSLFIRGMPFLHQHPVRPAVFAVVGSKDDDGVFFLTAVAKGVQHTGDVLVNDVNQIGVVPDECRDPAFGIFLSLERQAAEFHRRRCFGSKLLKVGPLANVTVSLTLRSAAIRQDAPSLPRNALCESG